MRVIRGYKYDSILVVDSIGYLNTDIAHAVDDVLSRHGIKYPAIFRPLSFSLVARMRMQLTT
jgi:hypothetical protein